MEVKKMHDYREVGGRATQGAVAEEQFSSDVQDVRVLRSYDCMDLGTPLRGVQELGRSREPEPGDVKEQCDHPWT
jgi:hypothetical protein